MAKQKVFVKDRETVIVISIFIIVLCAITYFVGAFFGLGMEKIGLAFLMALIMYNLNLTSCQLRYRAVWFNALVFFAFFLLIGSQNREVMTDAFILYFYTICVASTHLGHINYRLLQAQNLLYLTESDTRYF